MARPKPDVQFVQVLLRLHPDVIAAIDKRRGDRSRPEWVRTLVTAWAADQLPPMSDAEVGRVMRSISPPAPSVAAAVPFGPVARRPGELAKKR